MPSPLPSPGALRSVLNDLGYFIADVSPTFDEEALLDVARTLGQLRPASRMNGFVDRLTARPSEEAFPNSQSSRFGLGEFPLHTDDAVSAVPAKYLLLHALVGGAQAETTLLDSRSLLATLPSEFHAELTEAVFYFSNTARSFTSSVVDPTLGFIRFDPNIMRSSGERSRRLRDAIQARLANADVDAVNWSKPRLFIADNHRMLHARRRIVARNGEPTRTLLRVLVQEDR